MEPKIAPIRRAWEIDLVGDVRLSPLLIDPSLIDSVALRRIVEEVRIHPRGHPYDRWHNRHNR